MHVSGVGVIVRHQFVTLNDGVYCERPNVCSDNGNIAAVTRLLLHLHAWVVPALSRRVRKLRQVGRRILGQAIEQLPLLIIHIISTTFL
jgi:hypothetical protein